MKQHRSEPGPPMTLGNMRSLGVYGLLVSCLTCRHESRFNVEAYPDRVTVPSFGRMMVCTKCGSIGADVRPN